MKYPVLPVAALIGLFLSIGANAQDPQRRPPVIKPDIKPEIAGQENVNAAVKVISLSEWDSFIAYPGTPNASRIVQLNLRADPNEATSARIAVAFYFEQNASRKVVYNAGNSLYAYYPMSEYAEIVSKLQAAFKEGKSVWIEYSKTNSYARVDVKIQW